ncbi:alpha/beta hydrolase [Actibacterium sp. 188UL27-1]|uniref:alpha/beta hydrolase n=1 Tax=Actibacterium sp. 188UL27-1 TaxID=2786961 RepID=UPI00195EA691|nr:alpha/beta hydrolase [Actibacterium sp. 188UL27-1]MBM7068583.1 alpha/beta fold hydrolase [Actibacterium sp. 188UL27-1]
MHISLFGEIAVHSGDTALTLPSSRKARALLGYLAATARPTRRERLCELFWELPDDPRGSLRWALSKIREVVNADGTSRVEADRERVLLANRQVSVDIVDIRRRLRDDPCTLTPGPLREMADTLARPFLEGLDAAGGDDFQLWLGGEREDANLLYLNVLRQLAVHPQIDQIEALKWARLWQQAAPFQEEAARQFIKLLTMAGRFEEAERTAQAFEQAAQDAGLMISAPIRPDRQAETPAPVAAAPESANKRNLRNQSIGFCRAGDGTRIAYATVGQGPPLIKAANWLNHLELDWGSPIWGPTFSACANGRTFIRYDERGNGLSDWEVPEITFEAFVRDLETVVDALGLDRFPLLGISQGCAVSVEYAARHPDRVSGLILVGGYATGWRIGASQEERARRDAVLTLTEHGWGTSNPAYRHIFSRTFMPDADPADLAWFDEFQRQTTSPQNAVQFQKAFGDIDVRDSLGKVRAPTIVFHGRGDQRIAMEQGRDLANAIPGAQFVPLESRNHILLGHEPAWTVCHKRAIAFLRKHGI